MSGANGKDGPESPGAGRPLSYDESVEIRRAVGRLHNGARELTAVAIIVPIFLAGAELAAEGFSAAARQGQITSQLIREAQQRSFERALFVGFFAVTIALAIRARVGASRAAKVLPDALAEDPATRERARAEILRLGGPAPMRRAAEWIAAHWKSLAAATMALVAVANFLPIPNPVWLGVFLVVAVGIDVRWRAMIADVADQLPR